MPGSRSRGLQVTTRKDRPGLWIVGRVNGVRVRKRAASDDRGLALEESSVLTTQILRQQWHGERRGSRKFAEAVLSYTESSDRSDSTRRRLNRILGALGDVSLAEVDQAALNRVRRALLGHQASPATVRRGIITPIRAVMMHAHRQGWCDRPAFEIPKQPEGRTRYLLPNEAEKLIEAAAAHLRPLLVFLVATGARMSEAIELDWRDVDLVGGRAIFWKTKGGKRRDAVLPPRAITALANIDHREGRVFRWATPAGRRPRRVKEYADRRREGGGQIKTGWRGALKRAGIDPNFTPHDLRHTWATWQYALRRDLLGLKVDGGWSSVTLVERYAHLMPAGYDVEIRAFLGHRADTSETNKLAIARN